MLIEKITMPDFEKGLSTIKTVIIPFGSVEEHGSHLPLGTDTIHAVELAYSVASQYPVFAAPPVWYGLCRSTSQHPGTITIDGATLKSLAVEIASSFYQHGLKNFIFLSGHAGGTHMAYLIDAGERLLELFEDVNVAVLSIIDLVKRMPDGVVETEDDSHAGEVETSLMQYLRPDDVKGCDREEYPSFPDFLIVRDKKQYWKGGVWGNPAVASASKGKVKENPPSPGV
jgi:creatinine amidohydrolase